NQRSSISAVIFGEIIKPPWILSAANKIARVFNTLSEIVPALPGQFSSAASGRPTQAGSGWSMALTRPMKRAPRTHRF
ncbi:MAG: hypothetical protein CBC67_08870, partial [Gammaproteobacteria bacterium TMED107]